jgi:MFS transporter, ACS family, tartrate transporter
LPFTLSSGKSENNNPKNPVDPVRIIKILVWPLLDGFRLQAGKLLMESVPFNEKNLIRKLSWRIIPYLMLLQAIAFMDRINISFAALTMNKDLGISSSMYGMIAGIFFLAYFLFEIPSNIMMQKFGARIWITRILITWGAVTILIAYAKTSLHVSILRFLLGMAEAGFAPSMLLYMTFWFPAKYRAKSISVFLVSGLLISIIAGPISTAIMDHVQWFGLQGWRWLFILEGAPAVICGLLTYFVMTDRPEQAKYLTAEEKKWLHDEFEAEHQKIAAKETSSQSKWDVIKQPRMWRLTTILLCFIMANYGITMWLPQIIKGFSSVLTNSQVGLLAALPPICAATTMILGGWHSDKTQERRYHVSIPFLFACFGLIGITLTSNLWISLAFVCITMGSLFALVGPFWAMSSTYFKNEGQAAVGIALINSVANLGGFCGPYLMGFLKDITGTINAGVYTLACFALMGFIMVIAVSPPGRSRLSPE